MSDVAQIVLLIQTLTTWLMLGVFLFVQAIHYPLFKKIKEGFVQYERAHLKRGSFLLGPILLLDMVTAIILVVVLENSLQLKLATIGLVFVILTWLVTFFFQIQQHQKLSMHFSKTVLNRLVWTNLVRVLLWVGKSATFFYLLLVSLK